MIGKRFSCRDAGRGDRRAASPYRPSRKGASGQDWCNAGRGDRRAASPYRPSRKGASGQDWCRSRRAGVLRALVDRSDGVDDPTPAQRSRRPRRPHHGDLPARMLPDSSFLRSLVAYQSCLPALSSGVGAHAAATPPASPQARTLALWHGDIAVVYTVAFGLSAGSVFFGPAAASLLPTQNVVTLAAHRREATS